MTTWKFISWSQGKLLVFVTGQSRTSRGNTCHAWSFFWCQQILEKNMSHTQRQRWCVSIGVSFFLGSICKSTAGGSRNPRAAWFCTLVTFTGNTPGIIRVRVALHDCFILWFICSFVCYTYIVILVCSFVDFLFAFVNMLFLFSCMCDSVHFLCVSLLVYSSCVCV